ncbi:peptidoglycan DD-metalloendopeptidase family protein [Frateuria hangzhouensis]|uniref:peptidoglycan DD-metalloendopeptidase family protein n=1 Tax=Frateuria hangzhouensis TaxID=2995589 RepID=UPI0022609021|nr:peptidoglycan DD-metalloendopeptidase family protein [Frateuria sp. STR12]MCX7512337.1 peptidoglycan DD-metalloendopeptidase family protein [Frateuria sp. STR12]
MKKWMRFAAACLAALLLAACGRSVVVQPNGRSAPSRAAKVVRPATGSYRVVRGDTLYSIAFRNGLDFRDLAAWNGIDSPYTIWPGQVLRLSRGRSQAVSKRSPVKTAPRASAGSTPVFKPVAPAPSRQAVVVAGAATVAKPVTPAATPVVRPPKGATHTAGGVTWRWPADGTLIKKFQSGDAIPGIELAGEAGDPVRAAAGGVVVYSGNGLVGYGELIIIKHNDDFLSAYGHNRKRLVKEGQRVSAGQLIAEMGSTGAPRNELQFQIRRNGNPVDPLDYLPAR